MTLRCKTNESENLADKHSYFVIYPSKNDQDSYNRQKPEESLKHNFCEVFYGFKVHASNSFNHIAKSASLGIFQSALGLSEMVPTLGPSGIQDRLNC